MILFFRSLHDLLDLSDQNIFQYSKRSAITKTGLIWFRFSCHDVIDARGEGRGPLRSLSPSFTLNYLVQHVSFSPFLDNLHHSSIYSGASASASLQLHSISIF